MLTLFKKIFGKTAKKTDGPLAPSPSAPSPAQMQFESAIQMAKVEVAKLSLKNIVAKFPEDIRALLISAPDDSATVVLPIQTIVKQLPAGVVRMSLASLHRQAPPGLFKPLPAGDKRMVEVPLAEVFKHVKPTALKRRTDQRNVDLADEELELPVFNSRKETKPVAPIAASAPSEDAPPAAEQAPSAMRVVAPPSELNLAAAKTAPAPKPPKPAAPAPIAAKAASSEATLLLPLAKLSDGWPETVTSELAALDAATSVTIPHSFIAPGLARGKISCTWKQLCGWLTPPPGNTAIDPETALVLPLKVVAPAFMASTKTPSAPRKSVAVDDTIPALFSGGTPRRKAEVEPTAPLVAPEPPAAEAPPVAEHIEAKPESAEETPAAIIEEVKAPADEVATIPAPVETPGEPAAVEKASEAPEAAETTAEASDAKIESPVTAAATADAPVETPAEPAATQSVGDVLGEPGKKDWTPAALVNAVVKLPGVAGAVVALQEGFQVAHALPDGVNAETVSAFLPQIFTRLNQYAGEMKLGEVDDLLFTTRGAHCLIYRLGSVYLAVLGKPGASLPWNALRLVASELSRQVQK